MLMLPDYRVRQRDFLLELSRAITARLDLSDVLKLALKASVIMLGGQIGLIALRASDGQFYVRAASGVDSDKISVINQQLQVLTAIAIEHGIEAEAFNEKLGEMAKAVDPKMNHAIALPLIFAKEPLGMMIVFRDYRSEATANDFQILRSFADQAAIAVHNAQLYERINTERHRLEAILEHNADGVMILDAELVILRFNRALERMTGYDADDVIGQVQGTVFQWEHLEHGDLQDAIDEGWPFTLPDATSNEERPLYVEGDLMRADGSTLSIGITYAPMFTPGGTVESIIANVRDITNFRRAQEMQNTFISVISHELKTPVAIIKGYAETLGRPDAAWEQDVLRENLGVIEDEADRLNLLIQDLLTASKLQAQRGIQLDFDDVDLFQLATRSVERFRTQTDKHIITLQVPKNFPLIQGDGLRLLQVIDNLIGNAIKYSPAGGTITVGGKYDVNSVTLYVSDEGVGLSNEDRKRVFERFFRVDGRLSRTAQGTGLGLYLSKAIIDAHEGLIDVESQPGQGSTFFFILPRFQIIEPD